MECSVTTNRKFRFVLILLLINTRYTLFKPRRSEPKNESLYNVYSNYLNFHQFDIKLIICSIIWLYSFSEKKIETETLREYLHLHSKKDNWHH